MCIAFTTDGFSFVIMGILCLLTMRQASRYSNDTRGVDELSLDNDIRSLLAVQKWLIFLHPRS